MLAENYPFRISVSDISKITIRGGSDVSGELFMAGGFYVSKGGVITRAEIANGKTCYAIDFDGNDGDFYIALYSGDIMVDITKNPPEEGEFDKIGDMLCLFNWEKGTMKPVNNKKIVII